MSDSEMLTYSVGLALTFWIICPYGVFNLYIFEAHKQEEHEDLMQDQDYEKMTDVYLFCVKFFLRDGVKIKK